MLPQLASHDYSLISKEKLTINAIPNSAMVINMLKMLHRKYHHGSNLSFELTDVISQMALKFHLAGAHLNMHPWLTDIGASVQNGKDSPLNSCLL